MKYQTALAALVGLAFAVSASAGFAQNGAPGSTPSKPNKVTSVPPPPPPGGPDKFVTQTRPQGPGGRVGQPRTPSVVDDLAPAPGTLPSTCYASMGPKYLACIASLVTICVNRGGTISYDEESFSCNT
jgi:hypothetical protein